VRRAQINAKIGRKILLDAGFSRNILAFRSMPAGRNTALMKFNVSKHTSVFI
jgi:hypothetical protein